MTAELITAIAALLAGLGGIISAFLLNRKTMALLEYRMGQVERKLDQHNGYAEKFSQVTDDISKIHEDVAVIKTKLEYIEKEAEK